MARKLPWAGKTQPEAKRARTANDATSTTLPQATVVQRGHDVGPRTRSKTPPNTARKRRGGSRTPSTSPPPGPPDAEPMIEGFDADDIWMMVEDEFQTLAQSFTAHLHHAEYRRLMKKAKEAPRKELPEPTSPVTDETRRKLQRQARDISNKDVLDRMIFGARSINTGDDADEAKVDDPWRGTALAGLISTSSKEKTSLKGLEKMPSSTRAAKGFSRAEKVERPRKIDAIDLLTRPIETKDGLKLTPRKRMQAWGFDDKHGVESDHQDTPTRPLLSSAVLEKDAASEYSTKSHRESDQAQTTVKRSRQIMAPRSPLKPNLLKKRKKVKEESNDDRLAEVPMFLL